MNNTIKVNYGEKQKSRVFRLGNRFFGHLIGDTFHRTVYLSRHLYRELNGFGVDKWLVEELKQESCQFLCFTEQEEARRYYISLGDFERYSKVIDHGYGIQLICPRRFWQMEQLPRQLSLEVGNDG